MCAEARTVTILFTDLVGSTELLQRAGDEQAQRIFKAHHRLLREAVESHGGHEVKWLGDGLMVAFDSAADAAKCAIAMQQASRRPTAGERLQIRAGLNVGEAFVDESDYFGTSVVVARRLCDRADAGQIFAADIVTRLLDGRGGDLSTKDLGLLELKGITNPVPAVEIIYQHDPMALLRKLPFTGRQAEYETLLGKLSKAQNGRGSIAMLAGEPGIGKTRLTEEFCDHASSSSTIIRGNCYEGDVAPPFGPWVEALRSLIEQLRDDDLREAAGDGAPEIAVLLPELRRRLPDTPEAMKLDPESERARIFDAIASFLGNASRQEPMVIFLDDLHWCDKPSLLLLEYVARGIADQRIVIVGTYRDVEVDRVHPLAQALAALRRMEHHERIAVKGFSEEAVFDLLTAIEPSEQTEPARRVLAGALFAQAEGNPFFIREVLNNLVESGKLFQQDGAWVSDAASIEELGIPEGIKEAVGRRLSRLSVGCNQMLGRASAFTSGFTWEELMAISDESDDELLDYLDEALSAQLVSERERGSYGFTHALVRATLYDELSTPRRVRLHRRVAESLESLYAGDIDAHLGELAAHYTASMGGDAEKAIDYSIRAGQRAMELVAWEEAAEHYRRALKAMPESGDEERRCAVLLDLANCEFFSSRFPDGVQTARAAAGVARELESASFLAEAALAFDQSAQKMETDLSEERLSMLDNALDLLGGEDSERRALVLATRVQAASAAANAREGLFSHGFLAWAGHKDSELLEQAQEALEVAQRVGDDRAVCRAAYFLHSYGWSPDNDTERLALAEIAFAAAQRAHDRLQEANLCHQLGCDLLALGEISAYRQNRAELLEVLDRTPHQPERYLLPAGLAALALAEGKLDAAETHLAEYSGDQANTSATAAAGGQFFFLRQMQGRLSEIEQIWRVAVERFSGLPMMEAGLACVLAAAEKDDECSAILERLTSNGLVNIPRDFAWKSTLCLASDACADIRNRSVAARIYNPILPYASSHCALVGVATLGSVARVLGRLAALLERWDDAEGHFEMALEVNDRAGYHAWTAWTRLNYGDMLLRRDAAGDREKARDLLQQALEAAREMGMAKVVADCERLLAQAG